MLLFLLPIPLGLCLIFVLVILLRELQKFVKEVAKTLKEEGFLNTIEEKKGKIKVTLSFSHKKPVVMDIKLISRPGLRLYKNVEELEKIKRPTIFLISTPKGVLSSKKAIKERVGGEILAEIL